MAIFHGFIGIQDNHIGLSLTGHIYGGIACIIYKGCETCFFQFQLHEAAHTGIVFND